jgi:hypothetical protein
MDHRWLISAVLLTGAVLACACGSGEVSGAGTPSEEPSGDPRIQDEVEIGEPTVDAGVQESTKPTAANTGCNASPYPSEDCDDIPGVPDTDCSDITEAYVTANCPGRICSNFYCKGGVIDIDTSNVTLRNFKHDADGSLYAIRINEGVSNTVIEYGEVWNGDSTVVYDKSNNLLFRYNYLHHSESDFIKADGTNGIYEYNFWEKGGSGEGTHADGVQTEPSSDNNEFRQQRISLQQLLDAEARNAVARRISAGHESALLFTWATVPLQRLFHHSGIQHLDSSQLADWRQLHHLWEHHHIGGIQYLWTREWGPPEP